MTGSHQDPVGDWCVGCRHLQMCGSKATLYIDESLGSCLLAATLAYHTLQ